MLAPWLKSGIAAAALSGMAATGVAFQDQLEWAKSKLMGAPSADPRSVTALSAAITDWRSLSQTKDAPFESYARFMLAHPGWPNDVQMRRAAEAALAQPGWSPSTAVALLRRDTPPNGTPRGPIAHAQTATGAVD
ncbi:MAG: lytic transglycosylase domain-containing protein, partial [Sphingomonas sp.]